jgi:hypothetical protein
MNYGTNARTAPDIYSEMEAALFSGMSAKERAAAKNEEALSRLIFGASCEFLTNTQMVLPGFNSKDLAVTYGCESINNESTISRMSEADLDNLVATCQIPQSMRPEAKKAVAVLLAKAKACAGNNDLYRTQHFTHGSRQSTDSSKFESNITSKISRKMDWKAWEAIKAQIPPEMHPVKLKPELDEKGVKWLADNQPDIYKLLPIEVKPAKTAVEVKPVEVAA